MAALFLFPSAQALAGPDDDARACTEAQALLDKGAALFDSGNAAAMAATYIADGSIVVVKRQHNASRGEVELQSFRGRADRKRLCGRLQGTLARVPIPQHRRLRSLPGPQPFAHPGPLRGQPRPGRLHPVRTGSRPCRCGMEDREHAARSARERRPLRRTLPPPPNLATPREMFADASASES